MWMPGHAWLDFLSLAETISDRTRDKLLAALLAMKIAPVQRAYLFTIWNVRSLRACQHANEHLSVADGRWRQGQ